MIRLNCHGEHGSEIAVLVGDAPGIFDAPLSLTPACASDLVSDSHSLKTSTVVSPAASSLMLKNSRD